MRVLSITELVGSRACGDNRIIGDLLYLFRSTHFRGPRHSNKSIGFIHKSGPMFTPAARQAPVEGVGEFENQANRDYLLDAYASPCEHLFCHTYMHLCNACARREAAESALPKGPIATNEFLYRTAGPFEHRPSKTPRSGKRKQY